MSDAGVTTLLNRFLAVLGAGRKLIVEYSNEVWNFGFWQGQYAIDMGRVSGEGQAGFYARRSADVHKLALDACTAAGRASDLIRVVGWQEGNPSGQTAVLDAYKARCVAQSYSFSAPTWIAIAPYYGVDPGGGSDAATTQFRDFLMNGSNTMDPLSAAQLTDIGAYVLLTLVASYVQSFSSTVDAWNVANAASVLKVSYEGSQSFTGAQNSMSGRSSADGPNYPGTSGTDGAGLAWDSALRRLNRHPRMRNLQYASMKQCLDNGFIRWSQFTSDQPWTQFGYWGAREFANQVVGPGDGTGGSHNNRIDLNDAAACEAVKAYALVQWQAV
jgi:hypothetical protein